VQDYVNAKKIAPIVIRKMEDRDLLTLETGTTDEVVKVLKKFIDRVRCIRRA
jgi:hypothetical protein